MNLEKLTAIEVANFICPLNDFDIRDIIIAKDVTGFCIVKMTDKVRNDLFPTTTLMIKFDILVQKLYANFNNNLNYIQQNSGEPIQNSLEINDLTEGNVQSIDQLDENILSNQIAESQSTEDIEDTNTEIGNSSDLGTDDSSKLLWIGHFTFPVERIKKEQKKNLERPDYQPTKNDMEDIVKLIFIKLNEYKLPEDGLLIVDRREDI
ncbi:unnamed protein product [Brachionus calyciflorus]|uniref:Uncharacterized protein n=1 Tax=Brachionus calyciflorus TaxID=104777 RepID=A0A814KCL3_9BILA|nr:unnamed protein product [Brachionus calyciflorus]